MPDMPEQTAEQAVAAGLRSSPNHPWLILPGPVDIAGSFAIAVVKWLKQNGWVMAYVGKGIDTEDIEVSWHYKPRRNKA